MIKDNRLLAVKILDEFEKNNIQLNVIRNKIFALNTPTNLSKARVNVLIKEVTRLRGKLDLMITHISGKRTNQIDSSLLSILRTGFYEIIFDSKTPEYATVDSLVELTRNIYNKKAAGFINAILRNLIRSRLSKNDWDEVLQNQPEWYSIPMWLQRKWKSQYGNKQFKKLIEKINKPSQVFLRIDVPNDKILNIQDSLDRDGVKTTINQKNSLKVESSSGKIFNSVMFKSGKVSVQDPASSSVVECLNVCLGETVLDVCAAPGTKALQLAYLVGNKGLILASDIDPDRVKMGINDIKRHKKNNIKWSIKDASKDSYPRVNKILIDAPCSGTGVISKKPDIRWRRKSSDIKKFASLQFDIINHCAQFLNSKGTMVYSTCSIEPEENIDVVKNFLSIRKDFIMESVPSSIPSNWIDDNGCLVTLPHLHNVDGMFATILKKL